MEQKQEYLYLTICTINIREYKKKLKKVCEVMKIESI